jgi:hypothetical protein
MSVPERYTGPENALANFKNSPYRLSSRTMLILLNIVFLMYMFLMLRVINVSDYAYHIEASAAIAQGVNVDLVDGPCAKCPHHLYHYLTIVIEALLPGENFKSAAILASMLSYVTLALVVASSYHRQLRGRHPWQAIGLTLALLLTGPILIFSLTSGVFQQSFVYVHPFSYHSATTTLMRPLALIVFLYAASALVPPLVSWGQVAMAAFVTYLLGNAKPSFNLAFVPASLIVVFYRSIRRRFVDYRVFAAILGVMLMLLGAQYLTTFNGGDTGSGVSIQPFGFLMGRGFEIPDILLKHLLSFGMPLVILILYWREAITDGLLGLAWVIFFFGLFFELFVVELGQRAAHGNFYWTGEITLFVLLFASVHFWLRAMGGRLDSKGWRARIVWGVWALHIIGGVYWYLLHLTA